MAQALRITADCIEDETQVCVNCKHFFRHYTEDGWPFYMGHCVYPRLKNRLIYETCENFEKKAPLGDATTKQGGKPN